MNKMIGRMMWIRRGKPTPWACNRGPGYYVLGGSYRKTKRRDQRLGRKFMDENIEAEPSEDPRPLPPPNPTPHKEPTTPMEIPAHSYPQETEEP